VDRRRSIVVVDALLDERRELTEWATNRYRDFHHSRLSNHEGGYSAIDELGHVTNRNIT
jgi:hypothetical protein